MKPAIDFSAFDQDSPPPSRRPMTIMIVIVVLFFAFVIYYADFVPPVQPSTPDNPIYGAIGALIMAAIVTAIVAIVFWQKRSARNSSFETFATRNGWSFQPKRSLALDDSPLADLFGSPQANIWYEISGTTAGVPFQLYLLQGYARLTAAGTTPPLYFTVLVLPPHIHLNQPMPELIEVRAAEDATYVIYHGNATGRDDVPRMFAVANLHP